MTTVVLADDEVLLRTPLATLLPLEGDITVLAEALDGETAIETTRPDVLVIDLTEPVDGEFAEFFAEAARARSRRPTGHR